MVDRPLQIFMLSIDIFLALVMGGYDFSSVEIELILDTAIPVVMTKF
ncbi:hypothetical protein [Hydrocoleum sp. CS-953]|nr:hypothetical protein [Hydrocoleum sp. CS-953]